MRRVYYVWVLMCFSLITASLMVQASTVQAQQKDRRGEPSALSTGYYVVDSDDNVPTPWRPDYFFVDTTFHRTEWNMIATGPSQNAAPGHFFFDPSNNPIVDTQNDVMAGPIAIGMGHSWNFYGANYDSVYVSSNGFIGFRPYAEAVAGSPPSYCRPNNVDLLSSALGAPHAIIAALWANLDMRHGGPYDTSLVYYRTSTSLDTFMVNYYKFRLRPAAPNSFAPAGFTSGGADRIFVNKFQIILANTDSSIQINYGPFNGSINNVPPLLAWYLFEKNVAIGLVNETGTQSTSVLFGPRGLPAGWDAVNTGCRTCNQDFKQSGQWAIKFKRWHNIVRALAVDYPPRNYEICLGTSVSPRGKFKNVDSLVHMFKVRYQIRNVVTGQAVYSRVVNALNILPNASFDTTFEAYVTNPNVLTQLGTFNACAIATTYDTNDVNIGDQWPFDDTVCTTVFGIRHTTPPYRDASNNYSKTASTDIPDQTLWVSIGAEVVEGNDYTWDPPPPRDLNGTGYGPDGYHSPVMLLDRADVNGNIYAGSGVGDTLVSFPINLIDQTKANLTFDYERNGRCAYPYAWDAAVMLGPEPTILNATGQVVRVGDSLAIEFKNPSEPACNPSAAGWKELTAIDGGYDFEFKKFFMTIPSQYLVDNFRFRLRLKAKYDGLNPPPPTDDNDPWYIDNPTVIVPQKPEIEVMWVRVVNPYTKIPASQAVTLPVYVSVKNMSSNVAIAFPIKVQIQGPSGNTVYGQTVTVNSLLGGSDSVLQMPSWNAQDATAGGGATFVVNAWLDQPGYDSYSDDNGTFTKFALNVEQGPTAQQEFAYDDAGLTPGPNSGNDLPGATNITGAGIGFNGNSGSFAMKFKLATKDTLYGINVYFGNSNQAPDAIRLSLMTGDPNSSVPGDTLIQNNVQATFQDIRRGGYFNQYWPYFFPKPIVLPGGADAGANQGIYWVSVSQLSLENMDMGGDVSRGGAHVTVADPITPQIPPLYSDPYGTQDTPNENNGDVSSVWAMEVTAGSGGWMPWTPAGGWWPVNAPAGVPVYWTTPGYANPFILAGAYTPMIRPLVSKSIMLPIDLVYLHGQNDNGSALLTWATSSEKDNAGFFVDRKNNATDEMFEKIGFVAAKEKNSSTETGYGYADRNVAPGTYTYQLIQMDVNGVEHVSNSVEIGIDAPKDFSLSQNYPNPFTPVISSTELSYTVPAEGPASLVIYNQLGQVVRSLVNGNVEVGVHSMRWDGKDNSGNEVASGTYICKLTNGEHNATIKMTVNK